jgi:hypothetical protein
MSVAFLLLTYKDAYYNKLFELNNNDDIFMHPKLIDEVSEEHKKFIIPKELIIETQWGNMSIIYSIINLLSYAYSKKKYDYFILLSEDTYPFVGKNEFKKFLEKQNGLSCFEYLKEQNGIYKSNVWWMLNNNDAKVIIDTRDKYKNIFINSKVDGTYDENYFLTVLKRENSNYKFNNKVVIYTKWLYKTILKHPFVLNKLTKFDIEDIKQSRAPFVRKTLKTFTIDEHKVKNKLLIAVIGTYTDQEVL